MKFKSNIEIQAGLEDAGGSPGTVNQLLSSTVTGTAWIDPSTIVAEAATLVVIACKNTSGAAIAQGTPVYQTGTVGATATIEIAPADALISANKLPAIGLLQTALNNNGLGFVVITGELTNFTTSPIDGVVPTTGDKVFVKSGGGLTLTKPTGEGNGIQNMGLVGKVSVGNSGSITVSSIMRTNDVPNLPEGRIWIGDGNTIVSDTVYVDEPNNRVGIGTTSPATKLHISDATTPEVRIQDTTNNRYLSLYQNNSNSYIQSSLNSALVLSTHGANERMRITTAGNVGIGTTSPTNKLQVTGGSVGVDSEYMVRDNRNNTILLQSASTAASNRSLTIGNATYSNIIVPNGNVGIGTTSPDYKLEVSGTLGVNRTDGIIFAGSAAAGLGNKITSDTSNNFIFSTSLPSIPYTTSTRMTILNNGNVGIGTTSPALQSGGTGLHINATTNSEIKFTNSTTGTTASDGTALVSSGTGFTINNREAGNLTLGTNNSVRLLINSAGNVGIGTTSPGGKLEINGGTGVATNGGTFIVRQDGDTAADGIAITSSNAASHRIWKDANGRLNIGSSSLPSSLVQDLSGNVGIGTTSPSEKLEVAGSIKATASTDAYKGYIKQSIACIATEKTASANYYLISYNTSTTQTSNQYYNRMVAAYDGRIKKVYIRDTGGNTPTASVVNIKKQVNDVTSSTVYSTTVTGSGAGMSAVRDFADNDFTFSAGDSFGILYQTTDSGGGAQTMGGVAINIIIEYNIT